MSGQIARIDLGDGVWAEVIEDKYNPLIKRRELKLQLHHELKSTPMRINVRLGISEKLGVDIQRVYVRKIETEYGIGISIAEVHIYDTVDRALAFEPKYVIDRNGGVNPFEEEEG
ncbi:MAG: 30S ribosomal protein S24e [Desulfurococcales archaeon]|nr:30S ribosomal protein S24e [Desulfurococcales archaeon]